MIRYFTFEWKIVVRENSRKHAQSIIIVDDQNQRITYAELTARGDALLQEDGPLQASSVARFLLFWKSA